ncbi:MAG: hypothetical protein M3Z64_03775 [Verrucomicrobiota bacterium]|nr:hypothetical protein [Verrucomicrobiota bacterium]
MPDRFHGAPIAGAVLILAVAIVCWCGPLQTATRAILFFIGISTVATYRYLLFIPLPLVTLCFLALEARGGAALISGAAVATVSLIDWSMMAYARADLAPERLGYPDYFVPLRGRVSPDYRRGPPIVTADGVLLAPLWWEETKSRHRRLEGH